MGEPAKFILLTGGNSGIGLEACKILCAEGHKVVATVRSDDKGEHMLSEVRALAPNADINYMICEMDDPRNIKTFAAEFKTKWLEEGKTLDVLINNAGTIYSFPERVTSKINPDWEQTMVVNALAPILLTDLLMDNLKETAEKKGEARVVFVNSSVTTSDLGSDHQTDFNDLMIAAPGKYKDGMQTYKNSKLALMMATLGVVDELEHSKVTINSMCPGAIFGTNFFKANTHESQMAKINCFKCCCACISQSNRKGSQYIVDVADGKKGRTHGLFYVRGKITSPPPAVQSKENQAKMLQILREMANSV